MGANWESMGAAADGPQASVAGALEACGPGM